MGEAKTGVSATDRADAEHLETEIAGVRLEIDELIEELDRRRREVMDLKLQVSRHAVPIVVGAMTGGLVLAGVGVYVFWHHRHERKPSVRLHHARFAARRALKHPERVARGEPPLHIKLLTATLTALAGATAKKLVERAITAPPPRALLLESPPGTAEEHHAAFRKHGHALA